MKSILIKSLSLFLLVTCLSSCVSKKKFLAVEDQVLRSKNDLKKCGEDLSKAVNQLSACQQEQDRLRSNLALREEQVTDLKDQITDIRSQRDKQLTQVDDLTSLSQSATTNIEKTLEQLEQKDQYIDRLQAAKTRADSINLALAVNLKGVLTDGIADNDIEVKVDKTVVFINLSDKMLYQSGSAMLTTKARDVLGKISQIVASRPDLEVMVEGYTDNVPINSTCMQDNWDLSVKRATSVVRTLQNSYGVNPDRLIAAGRGQYNMLASNDTAEGRSMNRRTRIIILPKLDQFYDLLNPDLAPGEN